MIVKFEQPVNDPPSDMSVFKKGSTVPLKFKLLKTYRTPRDSVLTALAT